MKKEYSFLTSLMAHQVSLYNTYTLSRRVLEKYTTICFYFVRNIKDVGISL